MTPGERLRAGLSSESVREDLLLAAACALAAELEVLAGAGSPNRPVAALGALVMSLALVARRRAPLTVLAVVLTTLLAQTRAGVPSNAQLAAVALPAIAAYSVAAHSQLRTAAVGLGIGTAMTLAAVSLEDGGASDLGFGAALMLGPWLAGLLVRRRADQAARSEFRAEEATQRAARAAEEERARIARELHDLISHSLSVMVVQAGAAERLALTDPGRAVQCMQAVQRSGRQAVDEMRHLLDVLRTKPSGDLVPQPGLAQLPELVADAETGGNRVRLLVSGEHRPLPLGLELSAFRVIQEALTNVRKHAPGCAAEVRVSYAPELLEVSVEDNGTGPAAGYRAGHGLVGMQERVRLYGGTLEAGPGEGGGWHVRALFPLSGRT